MYMFVMFGGTFLNIVRSIFRMDSYVVWQIFGVIQKPWAMSPTRGRDIPGRNRIMRLDAVANNQNAK